MNPYAVPGDSEGNHLSLPGIRFHEANDYFGETDKLISGVGSLSIMETWRHFSVSLSQKGRFIQPIIQTRNDQPKLKENIGVYAESMETFLNTSITLYSKKSMAFKINLGGAYSDIGDHGFVNIYRKIHEVVASPISDDNFGEKLKDHFYTSYYGFNFVFPLLDNVNYLIGAAAYNSSMMRENAIDSSLIISFSKKFAMSLRYTFVDQKRSDWWELKPNRQQFILALRLFSYWTPSLMYVSPFIKGDTYGQYYLSPISFTIPF